MPGFAVVIQYDPEGKPFMALTVDTGMSFAQHWIADKQTAAHNVAEIVRQLKAASHDLANTPDKLIEVKGSLDDLLIPQERAPGRHVPHSARRPPQRPGRTRP